MKKIFISLILLSLFALIVYAKDVNNKKWTKLNNYLYIDKSSITKTIDGFSAWFKFYDSSKNDKMRDKINGIPIYYHVTKIEAACELWAVFTEHTKYYDKNNVLLYDEVNTQDIGGDCSVYIDGETICKALCVKR